jgi:hypothetical protein
MKKTEAQDKLGGPSTGAARPGGPDASELVTVQLLGANEQTGLGQPGSIVQVARGTAIRMHRMRLAEIVTFEPAAAPLRQPVAPAELSAAADEESEA